MNSPAFRVDILDGQTGKPLKRIPLDYAVDDGNVFNENWPIDADCRCVMPTPTGYPLEIRIRRVL